jgi:hypothetical protein
VQQQFRSPSKVILFTSIQAGSAFVLSHRSQRIPQRFVEITEQSTQVRFILFAQISFLQHLLHLFSCPNELSAKLVG